MFHKILIANRGEIAIRILRACREMGIPSAVVYSEADQHALHVRMAEEAILVGPAPASQSYLSIENILEAAKQCEADAVHPGYGFLSENEQFAQAVSDAGLTFIGPTAQSISMMGDKGKARETVQSGGVPVVPGYQGVDNDAALVEMSGQIGFPIMVKAASGGGGKGMRIVNEPGELQEAISAARREAQHAFGDQHLILERYIPHARHIEFQVLADQYGSCLHLFERECSIQRRHQKIIEESPSPFVNEAMRQQMGAAAVAAAQSVNYTNAGTIEFIVDPETRSFYFLEMNTRLQVEHPITELVVGLDLVQLQIRIAAGERLPFHQQDLAQRGHAIECRLYAEDPANNFLPATGKILGFIQPQGPGIRVDAGFTTGDDISIHYDPLVAKLITWAENRQMAIQRMQSALCQTVILGLTNNDQFLQDVLASPDFLAGNVSTTWVEETFGDWQPPQCELPPEVLAAAALSQYQPDRAIPNLAGTSGQSNDPYDPWQVANGFRVGQ